MRTRQYRYRPQQPYKIQDAAPSKLLRFDRLADLSDHRDMEDNLLDRPCRFDCKRHILELRPMADMDGLCTLYRWECLVLYKRRDHFPNRLGLVAVKWISLKLVKF